MQHEEEAVDEWIATAQRRGSYVPLPGSAAARERNEKAQLLGAFKELAGSADHIESRIQELKRMVRETEDRFDPEDAWTLFADLPSLPPPNRLVVKQSIC